MCSSNFRILIGPAALLALAVVAVGCGGPTPLKADPAASPAVVRVEVVKPERATIRRSSKQPGQVEAYEVTPICPKVAGYVRRWNVDIGARVAQGQILAELSVPELDAEAERNLAVVEEAEAMLAQAKTSEKVAQTNLSGARAKLEEAQASVKRADAALAQVQAEFGRVERLHQERVLTGSLLDEERSKLRSTEAARDETYARVKSAQVAVLQGQALLEKARTDVAVAAAGIKVARWDARRVQALREYADIVAPYDGVITDRNVGVGELADPDARGRPLFIVARDDVVRIIVSVPEMYATEVEAGDRALVRLQALPGRSFEGKVTRHSWTLDARNRTLRVEIDVPNPERTLRPGLYADTTIVVQEHADALCVPTSALVREGPQTFCVAVIDGGAVRKPVKVGLEDGARVEILSGLLGDEVIVKARASTLSRGQPVAVIEPKSSPTKP